MDTSQRTCLSFGLVVVLSLSVASCGKGDPEKARQSLHLPKPGYTADATRGQPLFSNNCARCHGGRGQGAREGPPLVHKIYRPGHHPDLSFHIAVKNGVRRHHWTFDNMPPIPGVSPEEVSDIVAYVRALQRQAGVK